MPTSMIYNQQGYSGRGTLGLGIKPAAPTAVVLCAPDPTQEWALLPLPGTAFVFLKHETSGLYATFSQTEQSIVLAALNPEDASFTIQLKPAVAGYVFINDSDAGMVMDVRTRQDGASVIPNTGTGSQTRQWLFAPLSS
jgi:hypothetical protein